MTAQWQRACFQVSNALRWSCGTCCVTSLCALRSALTAHVACGGCYSSGVDSCGMGGSKICKTLCGHNCAGAWVLTIDSKIFAQEHHCSVVHTLECIPLCDFCPITSSVPPSLPSFLSYSLPLSLSPSLPPSLPLPPPSLPPFPSLQG